MAMLGITRCVINFLAPPGRYKRVDARLGPVLPGWGDGMPGYGDAWQAGLKGCTTFRANPITGSVLGKALTDGALEARHCCTIDREAD